MIQKLNHAYGRDIFGRIATKEQAEAAFNRRFVSHALFEKGPSDEPLTVKDVAVFPFGYPGDQSDFDFAFMSPTGKKPSESLEQWNADVRLALRFVNSLLLAPETRIFAVFYDDDEGRAATSACVDVFGVDRVMIGILPLGRLPSPEGISLACDNANPAGSADGISSARQLEKEYYEFLTGVAGSVQSTGLETLDKFFKVSPGELTVVTGYPNQGKSEFVDQLIVNLWRQDGGGAAYFSPENKRGNHVRKLAEKAIFTAITDTEGPQCADGFNAIADSFFWIHPSNPTISQILARAEHLASFGKIKRLVIDPYNRIEQDRRNAKESETEYVCRMLSEVSSFAKRRDLHVFFVAHPRKPETAEKHVQEAPGLSAISGSQHWVNMADNGLAVSRGEEDGTVKIYVRKIREKYVGEIGDCLLSYDWKTGIYSDIDPRYSRA